MEEDNNSKRLPVTSTDVTMAAAPTEVLAAVELVSEWALLTACCTVFIPALVGLVLIYFHVHCTSSSVVLRCAKSTDAAEADERAIIWGGVICCAVLQTAVAMLARLLPSRRRWIRRIRHGLAFVALVVTIVGHCMYAAGVRLRLAADPGYLFYRISTTFTIFILAVGDVFIFIAFLVAPGGAEE